MDAVRSAIGPDAFAAWLASAELEDYDEEEGRLVVSVPNDFYRRWIEKRYLGEMSRAFQANLGRGIRIEFHVAEGREADEQPRRPRAENGRGRAAAAEAPAADLFESRKLRPAADDEEVDFPRFPARRGRAADSAPAPRLNPRYVFEEFVVGESNRYAHATGVAVADPRGQAFNPLFIYGGSGLGKTHLMQAIGHKLYQADNRLRIIYVTSEQFINQFIDAIQNKKHLEFREAYRNVDLLLIDDVQFLMGKERTQQEFFHTFNALYDAGKKVVVTSDRPPKELTTLEERLRSRFEWGLLVDIQPPDLETRVAILKKKADAEGIKLPNDVIFFIAERVTENIREMEGALKRLKMASSLHSRAIDLETAREMLGHLIVGQPQPRVTVEDVQRAVCGYFGIQIKELLGANRSKKFSQPRHLAQYLSRKLTSYSFPDIAQKFGGKDHTSIIYACRKVESAMSKDPNLANIVNFLTKQVTKGEG